MQLEESKKDEIDTTVVEPVYTLYHECAQGYVSLFNYLDSMKYQNSATEILEEIYSIIGRFSLDPHKVIYTMLYYLPLENEEILKGLMTQLTTREKLSHLIGSKFSLYLKSSEPAPARLYDVAVALEMADLVDFAILSSYLGPEPGDHASIVEICDSALVDYLTKIEYPPLSLMNSVTRSREEQQQYSDLTPEEVEDFVSGYFKKENQVFSLAAAYLRRTCDYSCKNKGLFIVTSYMSEVFMLLEKSDRLEIFAKATPLFTPSYRQAMLGFAEEMLNPLYNEIFKGKTKKDPFLMGPTNPYFPPLSTLHDGRLLALLKTLGFCLYSDVRIFSKANWVLYHDLYFYDISATPAEDLIKQNTTVSVLVTSLLPALCRVEVPNDLCQQINKLIQQCPYGVQILLYQAYLDHVRNNIIVRGYSLSHRIAARRLMKMFTNKPVEIKHFLNSVNPLQNEVWKISMSDPVHMIDYFANKAYTDEKSLPGLMSAFMSLPEIGFTILGIWIAKECKNEVNFTKKSADDLATSSFVKLGCLIAEVTRYFPEQIPLHFILEAVLRELCQGSYMHLHVLKKLLVGMTGFEAYSVDKASDTDVLAGGPILISIALNTCWQRDVNLYSNSSRVLKDTLKLLPRQQAAKGHPAENVCMGAQFMMVLAKMADFFINEHCAEEFHLMDIKEISAYIDLSQSLLFQFIEFLEQYTVPEEYWRLLPPVKEAIEYWQIDPSLIVTMYRGSCNNITQGFKLKKKSTFSEELPPKILMADQYQKEAREDLEKAKAMVSGREEDAEKTKRDETDEMDVDKKEPKSTKVESVEKSGVIVLISDEEEASDEAVKTKDASFIEAMSSMLRNVPILTEKKYWDYVTPEFYTLFWSLKLSDLRCPDADYIEIQKRIEKEREQIKGAAGGGGTELNPAEKEEQEKRLEILRVQLADVRNEHAARRRHVRRCREVIGALLRDILSAVAPSKRRVLVSAIVQNCLMLRICRSQTDAVFCFEFINFAHSQSTANFPTVFILDKIIRVVFQTISMMTTAEVDSVAIFMSLFFVQQERWRANKELYDKEFGKYLGAMSNPFSEELVSIFLIHDDFVTLNRKWMVRICRTLKSFLIPQVDQKEDPTVVAKERQAEIEASDALRESRYMYRRTAIYFLWKVFPVIQKFSKVLIAALDFVKSNSNHPELQQQSMKVLHVMNRALEHSDRWIDPAEYVGKKP